MKPILYSSLVTILTLVSYSAQLGAADEPNPPLPALKANVRTLAVFKNGLGFCIKAGRVEPREGWASIEELPTATLGTLWMGASDPGAKIDEVIAEKAKTEENRPVRSQAELLAANAGKRVKLTYSAGPGAQAITVEGTLLNTGTNRPPVSVEPTAATLGARVLPEPIIQSDVVLLRANDGEHRVLAVERGLIQTVELPDDSSLTTRTEQEVNKARFHLRGNPGSAEVSLAYLEKGITWSPSYEIQLQNDHTAELTLEAVLMSDVEDLNNADVSFVVGYPNFLYADQLSPMSLQQSVASFVQSLISAHHPEQANRFANILTQSAIYNTAAYQGGVTPQAEYSVMEAAAGASSEDLYFYQRKGVTLKKGGRARYEILSGTVPCQHIYQWDVPDEGNVDERGYRTNPGPQRPAEPQVWHMLRLENTTKRPWTTAPAFTRSGNLPLGQDILNYAPAGAKTTVRLTLATDVRGEQSQTELGRKALQVEGRVFDEVRVAGKLKLTNYKTNETTLVVKKTLVGEVSEADAGAKVTKLARHLVSVNPESEIQWEFKLPPGKDKELHYEARVLINR